MLAGGQPPKAVAKLFNVERTAVWRALRRTVPDVRDASEVSARATLLHLTCHPEER
jgi:hypothetical protein